MFLALDEAQWYAHDGLLELLRLGRRGNIHVWTATQALRSMGPELHEALVTNSADLVLFRGDPEEAHRFSRWMESLSVDQLSGLPRGQAAVLIGKGNLLDWVAIRPLPPDRHGAERRDLARTRTIARWGGGTPGEGQASIPPSEPSPGRSDAEEPAARLRRARQVLRELLVRETPGRVLSVSLSRFREALGLAPEEARALGSEIKEAGWLVRSSSGAEGTVWQLRVPDRFPVERPPATSAEQAEISELVDRARLRDIRQGGDKGH